MHLFELIRLPKSPMPALQCPADDGLDNPVVADSTCNSRKSDFLAATRHVENRRRHSGETALEQIVSATSWHRDESGTLGVARAIYLRLPTGFQPGTDTGSSCRRIRMDWRGCWGEGLPPTGPAQHDTTFDFPEALALRPASG